MLEDDLDLEADLGIDTVKQVEIFAKVAAEFNFPVPEDLKLRDLNTIAKLSAYVNQKSAAMNTIPATGSGASEPAASAAAAPATTEVIEASEADPFPDPASPIKRLVVRVDEARMPEEKVTDLKDKTILVSLDNHGFANAVIEKIEALGGKAVTLGPQG